MGKIYTFMGLTCGAVSANMTTDQYQVGAHICYMEAWNLLRGP
jgi:hypothetical protein